MPQFAKQITQFADGRFHVALELDDGAIVSIALQAPKDGEPEVDPGDRAEATILALAETIDKNDGEELQTASSALERHNDSG